MKTLSLMLVALLVAGAMSSSIYAPRAATSDEESQRLNLKGRINYFIDSKIYYWLISKFSQGLVQGLTSIEVTVTGDNVCALCCK